MGKPSRASSAVLIEHDECSIRVSRVGRGPLVSVWVHENGNGGRGMILDVAGVEELMDGLDDLLDEIENEA
jgi:hypothetical protein